MNVIIDTSKIQLGMPTLIELSGIEDTVNLCNELGLQFIELSMSLPQYQPETINTDKLLKIADKYNIYYTIHLDGFFNPCDFNTKIRNAYLGTLIDTINIAKKLGIPTINMHMIDGDRFTMPYGKVYVFNEYNEFYIQKQLNLKELCEREISGSDIKITIENASGFRDYHKQALDILLTSPIFGLCYDLGHNYGIGGTDEPLIIKYKDKLCHFHFHDAVGRKNHLALGTGEIDLNKYLALAKETHSRVVLETKTIEGLKQSVQWIKENGVYYEDEK